MEWYYAEIENLDDFKTYFDSYAIIITTTLNLC